MSDEMPEPVAFIYPRQLARGVVSLRFITKPEYRSWADVQAGFHYMPVYTADQLREVMAERDALRAELESLQESYGQQLATNVALRADAERYRWLRGGPDVPPESNRWARWEVRHWCGRWWNTLFAEALDAAIDAAMKGTP